MSHNLWQRLSIFNLLSRKNIHVEQIDHDNCMNYWKNNNLRYLRSELLVSEPEVALSALASMKTLSTGEVETLRTLLTGNLKILGYMVNSNAINIRQNRKKHWIRVFFSSLIILRMKLLFTIVAKDIHSNQTNMCKLSIRGCSSQNN